MICWGIILFIKYVPYSSIMKLRNICYRYVLKSMGGNSNIIDGVTIVNPTKVSIGNNVSIHPYTYILGKVTIGNYVGIASKCSIIAETHNSTDISIPYKLQGIEDQPISIGNDVWIGAHSIILGNSKIGDGVIISAGSVVSGEIPPYSVVMGNPARVYYNRMENVFNKKIDSNSSKKAR